MRKIFNQELTPDLGPGRHCERLALLGCPESMGWVVSLVGGTYKRTRSPYRYHVYIGSRACWHLHTWSLASGRHLQVCTWSLACRYTLRAPVHLEPALWAPACLHLKPGRWAPMCLQPGLRAPVNVEPVRMHLAPGKWAPV